MIALLCPSRARPLQCQRMVQSAYDTTTEHLQIFVAVSQEDFESYKEALKLPVTDRIGLVLIVVQDYPTAHKWNKLSQLAYPDNKLFMLAADDMIFETPGWDLALINHYKNLDEKKHVYHLQDSRDQDGTPHPIVTKAWIEKLGFFVPPIFLHWHVDSWTVGMAKDQGWFTHLRDYKLTHDKPSDRGEADETHNRIRQLGWHERDQQLALYSSDIYQMYLMRLRAIEYLVDGQVVS